MKKILIIDDNEDNLLSLEALISDLFSKLSILTAAGGVKGIELAKSHHPDVILLDILMPGQDGFEVCHILKNDETLRDIPVVFITAVKENSANKVRALEVGAEGFLSKPVDENELVAQIQAMLKIKAANDAKTSEQLRLEKLIAERTAQLEEELLLSRDMRTKLGEQNNLLLAIHRNAPLIMMVVNADRRIQHIDDFATRFANRESEEMLGLRGGEALRCMHALDDPRGCEFGDFCQQCVIRTTVLDTLDTGKTHLQVEAPYYFKAQDNEMRELWFLISTTPIEVMAERMALVTLQDITAHKTAEALLEQRTLELEQRNAALERFGYALSHQLKTPLVTLGTSLGLLEQELEQHPVEGMSLTLDHINKATRRMERLLDNLIRLLDIGTGPESREAISLTELVQEVIDQQSEALQRLDVAVTLPDEPLTLSGNPFQLQEIWHHLVTNAIEHMGAQPSPRIEIGSTQQNGQRVFYVRDNGSGLDPAMQTKIFTSFDLLDLSSRGAGLGPALVKRIVELYGGRIWVESAGAGQGSCFCFTLPATLQPQGSLQ